MEIIGISGVLAICWFVARRMFLPDMCPENKPEYHKVMAQCKKDEKAQREYNKKNRPVWYSIKRIVPLAFASLVALFFVCIAIVAFKVLGPGGV